MQPPVSLREEIRNDSIRDVWEVREDCYFNQSRCNDKPDRQPVIGILTQPVHESKKDMFNYEEYVLEVNDNFIRWGGSKTIAIPYNISDQELFTILPQINGVLFTGGGLTLVDKETNEVHPYMKTASKIVAYSKYVKDEKKETFPVMGIC